MNISTIIAQAASKQEDAEVFVNNWSSDDYKEVEYKDIKAKFYCNNDEYTTISETSVCKGVQVCTSYNVIFKAFEGIFQTIYEVNEFSYVTESIRKICISTIPHWPMSSSVQCFYMAIRFFQPDYFCIVFWDCDSVNLSSYLHNCVRAYIGLLYIKMTLKNNLMDIGYYLSHKNYIFPYSNTHDFDSFIIKYQVLQLQSIADNALKFSGQNKYLKPLLFAGKNTTHSIARKSSLVSISHLEDLNRQGLDYTDDSDDDDDDDDLNTDSQTVSTSRNQEIQEYVRYMMPRCKPDNEEDDLNISNTDPVYTNTRSIKSSTASPSLRDISPFNNSPTPFYVNNHSNSPAGSQSNTQSGSDSNSSRVYRAHSLSHSLISSNSTSTETYMKVYNAIFENSPIDSKYYKDQENTRDSQSYRNRRSQTVQNVFERQHRLSYDSEDGVKSTTVMDQYPSTFTNGYQHRLNYSPSMPDISNEDISSVMIEYDQSSPFFSGTFGSHSITSSPEYKSMSPERFNELNNISSDESAENEHTNTDSVKRESHHKTNEINKQKCPINMDSYETNQVVQSLEIKHDSLPRCHSAHMLETNLLSEHNDPSIMSISPVVLSSKSLPNHLDTILPDELSSQLITSHNDEVTNTKDMNGTHQVNSNACLSLSSSSHSSLSHSSSPKLNPPSPSLIALSSTTTPITSPSSAIITNTHKHKAKECSTSTMNNDTVVSGGLSMTTYSSPSPEARAIIHTHTVEHYDSIHGVFVDSHHHYRPRSSVCDITEDLEEDLEHITLEELIIREELLHPTSDVDDSKRISSQSTILLDDNDYNLTQISLNDSRSVTSNSLDSVSQQHISFDSTECILKSNIRNDILVSDILKPTQTLSKSRSYRNTINDILEATTDESCIHKKFTLSSASTSSSTSENKTAMNMLVTPMPPASISPGSLQDEIEDFDYNDTTILLVNKDKQKDIQILNQNLETTNTVEPLSTINSGSDTSDNYTSSRMSRKILTPILDIDEDKESIHSKSNLLLSNQNQNRNSLSIDSKQLYHDVSETFSNSAPFSPFEPPPSETLLEDIIPSGSTNTNTNTNTNVSISRSSMRLINDTNHYVKTVRAVLPSRLSTSTLKLPRTQSELSISPPASPKTEQLVYNSLNKRSSLPDPHVNQKSINRNLLYNHSTNVKRFSSASSTSCSASISSGASFSSSSPAVVPQSNYLTYHNNLITVSTASPLLPSSSSGDKLSINSTSSSPTSLNTNHNQNLKSISQKPHQSPLTTAVMNNTPTSSSTPENNTSILPVPSLNNTDLTQSYSSLHVATKYQSEQEPTSSALNNHQIRSHQMDTMLNNKNKSQPEMIKENQNVSDSKNVTDHESLTNLNSSSVDSIDPVLNTTYFPIRSRPTQPSLNHHNNYLSDSKLSFSAVSPSSMSLVHTLLTPSQETLLDKKFNETQSIEEITHSINELNIKKSLIAELCSQNEGDNATNTKKTENELSEAEKKKLLMAAMIKRRNDHKSKVITPSSMNGFNATYSPSLPPRTTASLQKRRQSESYISKRELSDIQRQRLNTIKKNYEKE